jgi:hypothetical protein
MSQLRLAKLRRQARIAHAIALIEHRRGELLQADAMARRAFPSAEFRRRLRPESVLARMKRLALILAACAACFLATPSFVGLARAGSPSQIGAVASGGVRITLTLPPRARAGTVAGCNLPAGAEVLRLRDETGAAFGAGAAAQAAACGRAPAAAVVKDRATVLVQPQ